MMQDGADKLVRHIDADKVAVDQQFNTLQKLLAPYPWAYDITVVAVLLLSAWVANWITKRILLRGIRHVLNAIPLARENGGHPLTLSVIPRLANVVPALVIYVGVSWVPDLPRRLVDVLRGGCQMFMVLTVALAIARALDLANEIYERRADARDKPIKGFLQVIKIVLFTLVAISIAATLAGVQFMHVLTGLGALMAVLILVFQDTLLSLVASVQISTDGRVRNGDWIEMPGQNADGVVTDIALHTVTVKNWDMTITTVPTKKLISDSFKNWRGMTEAGGRRIKRPLLLDQHSVRFLDEGEVARLGRFALLGDYLQDKQRELAAWNAKLAVDGVLPVNTRRLTNLGTFRAYAEHYLRRRDDIRQDMTLMVRQMEPSSTGLPLEVYCFVAETRLVEFNAIQSDIFEHLLAVLPEFGLNVYQESSDAALIAALRLPMRQ